MKKTYLLKVMKLVMLLLCGGFLHLSANSYSQTITLKGNRLPFTEVLNAIRQQTGYSVMADQDALKLTHPVTISSVNMPLKDFLEMILRDQPLSARVEEQTVMLSKKEKTITDKVKGLFTDGSDEKGPVQQSSIHVRGIVTDTTGAPLKGATISIVKPATIPSSVPASDNNVVMNAGEPANATVPASRNRKAYITSDNGLFYIDVEEGDELIVSFIGFDTNTFIVTKQMPFLTIILKSLSLNLNEVFVQTGYQKLSKERATGSFSKPNMNTFASRSTSLNVIARLDGQIPGLTITNEFKTQKALIRGTSSVRLSTEPLYVVDGVIVPDFNRINIDDIADITVLKDAAAAAIWGAQAANGVIVVVTKTGNPNQKIKLSYSGYINFQGEPDLDYQRYLTSEQYIQAAKEIFDPVVYPYSTLYTSTIAPHEQILYDQFAGLITPMQANNRLDSLSGISNRKQIKDLFYRNAFTTNHTLSASGGSNNYSFYTSFGYSNIHSNTPGEKNQNYRISLNQAYNPGERFSISLNTDLSNTVSSNKHPVSVSRGFLPYQLFRDANCRNINMPYIFDLSPEARNTYQQLSQIDLETYSPLTEFDYGHGKTNSLSLNLVANVSVKLWKGLTYQGTFGYLRSPTSSSTYDDIAQYQMRRQLLNFTVAPTVGSVPIFYLPNTGGTYVTGSANLQNWTVRNQLIYNYASDDGKHLITFQGGQEANERLNSSNSSTILGYDEDLQTFPLIDYKALSQGIFGTVTGAGFLFSQPYQITENRSRFSSYFALAGYTFQHKYSADASWRIDHSNLFGSDVSAQNKPVYSFGLKWNLKNEAFMQSATWLNALSLRGTYGISGNSPYIGAATTNDILSSSYSSITGQSYSLIFPANKKLSWETTHTTNLGVDFSVLDSRLSGVIEYYHKNTTNLLGSALLNPFTGQTSATSNLGSLVNNGINIGLNSINIQTAKFSWSTGVVFGYNQNKLVEYTAPQSYELDASYRLQATYVQGYAMNPVYAYRFVGLDGVGDPQIRLADGTVTTKPDSPYPTADDLVYMGSTNPKFNGGISNTFKYGQFELSVNLVYSLGAVMRKDVNQFYSGRLTASSGSFGGNVSEDFAYRWKQPGDELITDIPAYQADSYYNYSQRNVNYYTMADENVLSASYLKLRDATLVYNIYPRLLQALKIQSASIRLQVNDILLWKANKYGIDPEFQNFQLGNRTARLGQHAVTVGANVNF